ncbi:MAG: hypothetical protein WCE85_47040, partial [Paraburkholderia sp.]
MSDLLSASGSARAFRSVRNLTRALGAVFCAVSCGVAIAASGTMPAAGTTTARASASVAAAHPAPTVN